VMMKLLFWTCLGGVLLGLCYFMALGVLHR
jgi:hypothetical protein